MGRIMAVDWGRRRIGVALSDETRAIASPHGVVHRSESLDRDLRRLVAISEENDVSLIVFGLPVRSDGSLGPEALGVMEVVDRLVKKWSVTVATWDERLTTAAAERALTGGKVSREKRRRLVDKIAAALILQSFLDSGRGEAP